MVEKTLGKAYSKLILGSGKQKKTEKKNVLPDYLLRIGR